MFIHLFDRFQYNSTDHAYEQLNLNTASEDELMTLPGITRQTAQNIIAHRSTIGGFTKVSKHLYLDISRERERNE